MPAIDKALNMSSAAFLSRQDAMPRDLHRFSLNTQFLHRKPPIRNSIQAYSCF